MLVDFDIGAAEGSPLEMDNFEQAEQEAREGGFDVLYSSKTELFLDLDGKLDYFEEVLPKFMEIWSGDFKEIQRWPSKTNDGQHWHVRIETWHEREPAERVAMQILLGSDPRKELLTLGRLTYTVDKELIRLFRPKGVKIEVYWGNEWHDRQPDLPF